MKKHEIAILTDSKKQLPFLESFFRDRNKYRPSYFSDPALLLDHARVTPPAAMILGMKNISDIARAAGQIPSVALISGDIRRNIREARNCKANCYLYPPYLDIDLEHKIEAIIREKMMHEKMEARKKELEAVIDLTQLISDTLDSKELLYRIVRKIAEIIPVTRCSIIKIDSHNRTAIVVASYENQIFRDIKISLRKYPEILEALTTKEDVIIRDVATDPLMSKVRKLIAPLGIRSILVVPIFRSSKVIGTLFLRTSRSQGTFSEPEIRLLHSMANASANSLFNSFLFEQVEDEKTRLEKLSITDYLTGIYNVRYFYHRIIQEFSRAQRYSSSLSCLMLDIDFFKKVNDVHGHKTGDMVLKEFATVLRRHCRKSDVLARYGGEEFIILLPETAPEGAFSEAERIRKHISSHKFKSLKNKNELTVSIGIATSPHPKIKAHDDLIASADSALFTAKNSGRNRVAIYT
ncbi:MAG: sensor domain-containing diguanylate cyclase [Nitrospirae bacterium]|nr:MAG: sensor domain-containing diguanylate cyclase [Nitrospirota bacterium]